MGPTWGLRVGLVPLTRASFGSPLLFSLPPPATPTPTLRKHPEKEPPSLNGRVLRAFPVLLIPTKPSETSLVEEEVAAPKA